jgi:hypothetical protein
MRAWSLHFDGTGLCVMIPHATRGCRAAWSLRGVVAAPRATLPQWPH